ncbi:MAG TPA: hypothetical protein VK191_09530 [Symbiobacteriaceae bacterium]|nr:hypothetical protein [Symbiobacteriaceae bacterium]
MKFLTSTALSRLVGVSISTLHRWETWDGMWCTIYGHRIRVYHTGIGRGSQRRYSEAEVMRLVHRLDGRPAKDS